MSHQTSALLINEEPLQVLPSLAQRIGLNEAVVLQQLHYWQRKSKHMRDGRRWVFNSYPDWQATNFPFWSVDTVERTFRSLEKKLLILSDTPGGRDRRKWYSIDYDALNGLLSDGQDAHPEADTHTPSPVHPAPPASPQDAPMHDRRLHLSDAADCGDASPQIAVMGGRNLPPPSPQIAAMLIKVSESTTENTREHTHTARSAPTAAEKPPATTGVCVSGSKFTLQQVRAWTDHQKANGANIDPYAVALRRFEDGKADADIEIWLAAGTPTAKIIPRDTSACPDCAGKGLYYPEGPSKGVAKCTHPRLADGVASKQVPARASP